ncbi:MAG: cobalt ECF transporter T component CbiQ [Actinobacteria bacterium]|nr:cobalt ECF transporter T component CbiQ [Actinomycetota bacterium]
MHQLAPETKILSIFLFILVVVATPIENFLAYIFYFAIVLVLTRMAQIPLRTLIVRSLIEIPFIFFALLMPFFGTGQKVELFGLQLYQEGLLAGAAIVAKGTIGVMMGILLSTTTTAREILEGLTKLRIPAPILGIASFMIRYVNVVNDELGRMKIARESRGFEERGLRSWRILAQTVGALFIRSYERGERVYLAMLSRGYIGAMPKLSDEKDSKWAVALVLPGAAALVSITTGVMF